MGERKFHVKSRLGCTQCKARRVKCDEKRPTCGNCKRRQEPCTYKSSSSTATSLPDGLEMTDGSSTDRLLHVRQLELMHQYTTHTYHTVAIHPQPPETQLDLPKLGFEHDFLLDTIFAITSLHLVLLRPDEAQARIADAVSYQNRAIASTRERLQKLSASECRATFHCSAQLGLIILAFRAVDPNTAGNTRPTETLAQLAQLWRGTHLILRASKDLIDPALHDIFFPALNWSTPDQSLDPELGSILESLRQRAKNDVNAGDVKDVIVPVNVRVSTEDEPRTGCLEAIGKLQILFSLNEPEHSRVIAWLIEVPPVFWELVSAKDQLACAIVLLWSVTFRLIEDRWWVKNIPRQIYDELVPIVGTSDPDPAEVVSWVAGTFHHTSEAGEVGLG